MRVHNIILYIVVVIAFSSCALRKNTLLLKDTVSDTASVDIALNNRPYKIQVGDFLNINVTNPDKESVAVFEKRGEDLFSSAYMVRNDGTVEIPLIGAFEAKGYDLLTLQDRLEERLKDYFKFVTVNVSLVNFKVTFLGEVVRQGTVNVTNESTNFFEVLSKAGGLTTYSNTKKVKIVRKEGSKVNIKVVDISSIAFLSNEFYYLRPDDIVYIEPLRGKNLRTNAQLITSLLSIISIAVLIQQRATR